MSDKEPDDEVGLPKATVFKLISGMRAFVLVVKSFSDASCFVAEMLPPDMTCSKEAKEIMVECCVGEPTTSAAHCSGSDFSTESDAQNGSN